MPTAEDLKCSKRRSIVIGVLVLVLIFASAQECFASTWTKHGVTYFGAEDAFPSYLYLLSPSDRALVEKAQADIEKYRKSNVTITVVDENGIPLEGVEIRFNQTDHNFLFGFNDFDPFILGSADMMKQAGFNLFVACAYWKLIEPYPQQYKWNFLERQQLEDIRNIGFKTKVHPVVYYDPNYGHLIPSFLEGLTPDQLENETLNFISQLIRHIPDADIYELSNEGQNEWGRGGLTIDQYVRVMKEAASMIRALQRNVTITVNTDHTFGEFGGIDGEPEYNFPNISPYDWYELLISKGVDFDAIGVQFRPGYFNPVRFLNASYEQNQVLQLTEVSKKFDRFAALGKRMHITEFAVPSRQLPEMMRYGRLDWNETLQAAYVEAFYTLIFSKPTADSLSWWFVTSALPTSDESIGPRPFERASSRLIPKTSYYTLKNLITNRWSTAGLGFTDSDGDLEFHGFGGTYVVTIGHGGISKRVSIHVEDGASVSYRIAFVKNEILEEEAAAIVRIRDDARSTLQELNRIWQWSQEVNPARSAKIRETVDSLTHLYEAGQYMRVIESGKSFVENPFEIQLNGYRSDFEGFAPIITDPQGDMERDSAVGADLSALYAFADSSNLYVAMTVFGNRPDENASFGAEISTDLGTFHALLVWFTPDPGYTGQPIRACLCSQQPPQEGDISFACAHAFGEVIEMRIPLRQLKSPKRIYLNNVFIWQQSTQQDFDSTGLKPVEIPSLRDFKPPTKLDAQNVLQELDRIRQWLETVNKAKSAEMLNAISSLILLYENGQYSQVVRIGKTYIDNPLGIRLNGRLSDFEGFNPILRDPENDVALNSPPGTDITDLYAFADSSYLYISIRVLGDSPEKNATFTVEIKTDSGTFHVAVRSNGTQCSCWQEPWKEGDIYFDCPYALGEIVEMQVSLSPLESPETIYLNNVFIWQESTWQVFDSYDGPQIKIPNLRSFKPQTKLEIEKTETTYTTATAIGPLIDSSLVYVAIISTFVVLGVFMYWRKTRPRRSGSRVQSND